MSKKLVLASAIALGLGMSAPAHAINGVLFDLDGDNEDGGADVKGEAATVFDWGPGNTYIQDTLPLAAGGEVRDSTIRMQSKLSGITGPNENAITLLPDPVEYTFQLEVLSDHSVPVGTTHSWSDIGDRDDDLSGTRDGDEDADPFPGGDLGSFFRMYYSDTAAATASSVSGLGFGDDNGDGDILDDGISTSGDTGMETDEILILEGRIHIINMTFTPDIAQDEDGNLLDGFFGDNQNGVRTLTGTGSSTFNIDVTFADPEFFESDITSLLLDMDLGNNTNGLAFGQTNPSDLVVGFHTDDSSLGAVARKALNETAYGDDTTAGGNLSNNFSSGTVDSVGFHMQNDGSSTVFHSFVPEPSSVGLTGLALSFLGLAAPALRRRRRS